MTIDPADRNTDPLYFFKGHLLFYYLSEFPSIWLPLQGTFLTTVPLGAEM